MKKYMAAIAISVGLCGGVASADALKNSLTQMLHEKDRMPGMVDLSRLDQPKARPPVSRPPQTVIATVNGYKIRKKEADAYLKSRTNGKVADFDTFRVANIGDIDYRDMEEFVILFKRYLKGVK